MKFITVQLMFRLAQLAAILLLNAGALLYGAEGPRVTRDLSVLYTFQAGSGDIVRDRSGVGPRLDLKIEKPSAVEWREGALVVRSATRIRSSRPAKKIIESVKRSNAVTIEAWIRPANRRQAGPARIVSLSANASRRYFTLGQDGTRYDVRFRTTKTDGNGLPSTATRKNVIQTGLTHIVYTRDSSRVACLYVNGRPHARKNVAGELSNWKKNFHFLLADEFTGGRPWLGELQLVAVYSRALTATEIEQNFRAGRGMRESSVLSTKIEHERFFEGKIAPLLARNCLECHDPAARKGRLDLSRKASMMAGGESGPVIVPGKAGASLLWERIDSGDMPPDAAELSAEEKTLLRRWIDDGAVFSIDMIDPANYVRGDRAGGIVLQRLTVPEYIETVRSAVGVDIAQEAHEILPPDVRSDGFSNTAYNLNVDFKHVDGYARLAEIVVSRMDVLRFAERFSKSRKLSTDDTMREFVASMGKWLLRGPLDEREVTNYCGIATTAASAGGDYREVVSYLIEAMLQSPRFIYRIEQQRGDGSAWPVGEYELASRMSYILWGGPPDEELIRAADEGRLYEQSAVEEQVRRMLRDPRAIERSLQFIIQWLDLDRLNDLRPDQKIYPNWNDKLAVDMRAETLAFFEDVVWKQNRPLTDLLNAQVTYATPRLAVHYGLKPSGPGLRRYDLSSVPTRGGLLTQGSVLTVGGDNASMVTRGLFVLQEVLRGVVKDPPPGLDTTPVPSRPGLSQRQISEKRIANISCSGCHSKFEPLAFGLEKFDGLGSFHDEDEHGNKLRDDGEILFPGAAEPVKYSSSAELMDRLAESDRVGETLTWKVTQFALGRPLVASDVRTIRKIHVAAQEGGGTYSSLITAIVMSDLVRLTNTEANQAANNPWEKNE